MDILMTGKTRQMDTANVTLRKAEFNLAKNILAPDSPHCASLRSRLPALAGEMRIPRQSINVTILDDDPHAIKGIAAILGAWPSIKVHVIVQKKGAEIEIPEDTHILMLDGAMNGIRGEHVAARVRELGYVGVLACIGSGGKGGYSNYNFGYKNEIAEHEIVGGHFVKFVNSIIVEIEGN